VLFKGTTHIMMSVGLTLLCVGLTGLAV